MKIAVLGTGRVGGVLGSRWAKLGHDVTFGTRDPSSERTQQLLVKAGAGSRAVSWAEAAAPAEVVVLATPWESVREVLQAVGQWQGKILVDCINPLTSDFAALDLGHTTSAAERIAGWADGACVVKAFNTVSSAAMLDPIFHGQKATLFICGDDAAAKDVVVRLADELEFETVDAGPLELARYLEPLAMLYIQLAKKEGWKTNYAFKLLRR